MAILGTIVGIAEIVLGIFVLCSGSSDPVVIGSGIGYLLSGLLFLWLCAGASTAFTDSHRIDALEKENKNLKSDNDLFLQVLIDKGVISREELAILFYSNVPFEKMEAGYPLITLKEKSFKNGSLVVPEHSRVLFVKYDTVSYAQPAVIASYTINGEVINFKFAKDDVMSASLYEVTKEPKDE